MKKKTRLLCLVMLVGLLFIFIAISNARPGSYSCSGQCSGCTCWGNVGVDPFDDCCGQCFNYFWYGYDSVACCIGGQGCHF